MQLGLFAEICEHGMDVAFAEAELTEGGKHFRARVDGLGCDRMSVGGPSA